jgi:hypothetical protein
MDMQTIILKASGRLLPFEHTITKVSSDSILSVTCLVPVRAVDIVFSDNPLRTIPHIGFGGHTETKNLVQIAVNPEFPDLEKSIKENLPRTIAHELYHCLRNYSFATYKGRTLLDALINEGLADHFAIEVTGKPPEKWSQALTKEELPWLLERAKKQFSTAPYNHAAWFFGSEKENIPKWTGYALGFYVIHEYLNNHPGQKASTLYLLKSEEFI